MADEPRYRSTPLIPEERAARDADFAVIDRMRAAFKDVPTDEAGNQNSADGPLGTACYN